MATVTIGTSSDFNAGIYGASHQNTLGFLQQQYETLNAFSDTMSGHVKNFVQRANKTYHNFLELETVRKAAAALDRLGSVFQEDSIRWLRTETEVQQAPPMMIPFIMAEPSIRKLYQEQRCEGYGDAYIDNERELIGRDHTHYQLAMSGTVVVNEVSDVAAYTIWDNGETPLVSEEKVAIQSSWEVARMMVAKAKKDPTSRVGGLL